MPKIKAIGKPTKREDKRNKKRDPFYSNASWRNLRALKLKIKPLCEVCEKQGLINEAKIVDHHKPKRLWPELSLVLKNLTSMCTACHSKKSNLESKVTMRAQWHAIFDNHKLFNK